MCSRHVIQLHLEAPPKPALGAPCNGCGVCCLSEPCPLGVVVSRRFKGACAAVQWDETSRRYQCGVLAEAKQPTWRWLVRRWIAAGLGCDAALEVDSEPPQQPASGPGHQQK